MCDFLLTAIEKRWGRKKGRRRAITMVRRNVGSVGRGRLKIAMSPEGQTNLKQAPYIPGLYIKLI